MKVQLFFSLLFFLTTSNIIFAQKGLPKPECIYGDCKKGFGILKTENAFVVCYIGEFNKGKLNGKGLAAIWHKGNFYYKMQDVAAIVKEAGTLPSAEKLIAFCPALQEGEFKDGELVGGKGKIYITDRSVFPGLSWITRFSARAPYFLFEGSFTNSIYPEVGNISAVSKKDTLIGVADRMFSPLGPVIVESKGKDKEENFHWARMGKIIGGDFHGWVLLQDKYPLYNKANNRNKDGEFFRQLIVYGEKMYEDNGRSYPFDEQNPQTIQLQSGIKITGPMVNDKITGFGKIEYGNGKKYEGYIKNNLPDGYGMMDSLGNYNDGKTFSNTFKYGLFREGLLVTGEIHTQGANFGNPFYDIVIGSSETRKESYQISKGFKDFNYYKSNTPTRVMQGNYVAGSGWDGEVIDEWYGNGSNEKKVNIYQLGKLTNNKYSSTSLASIGTGRVLTKNGVSVYVKEPLGSSNWVLSDGTQAGSDELIKNYKPSRHHITEFFVLCNCGGSGEIHNIRQAAATSDSWKRTEQTNGSSSVGGYWQGVQKKSTTYTKSGYDYVEKSVCTNSQAQWITGGSLSNYKPIHMIPKLGQLKE